MKTKFKILLIIFIFPFVSCSQTQKSTYEPEKISKEVTEIVKKIAEKNVINSSMVGVAALKTAQYERFEQLVKIATTEELLEIMNHENPTVRGYTFWALAKRRYENLEEVYMAHAKDKEVVATSQGCLTFEQPLINFMKNVVTPDKFDLDCKKFDNATFNRIEK